MKIKKENSLKENNLIAVFAVVVLMLAFVNFSVTIYKINQLNQKITGFNTQYGYVNLTINSLLQLTASRNFINWSSGYVNTSNGNNNATLTTYGDSNGIVEGGTWINNTALAKAIVIKNTGNLNASMTLQSDYNAFELIGGGSTGGTPLFQWNISNNGSGAVACGEWGETSAQNVFANVNKSAAGVICNKFAYGNSNAMMFINVRLRIPLDANQTDIARNATFTITGNTAI